jgi:hypothetical protein
MTNFKTFLLDLVTLIVIVTCCLFAWAAVANAQPPGPAWTRAADGCNWERPVPGSGMVVERTAMACIPVSQYNPSNTPLAQPPDLCGREQTSGTLTVRILCPDYPALRRLTGSTIFPDEKGQQVFVRSTDPTTKAFRIAMTYRKDGHLDTVVKYADVHETYDSGAGWVLGDIEIVSVEVTELRETAKAVLP